MNIVLQIFSSQMKRFMDPFQVKGFLPKKIRFLCDHDSYDLSNAQTILSTMLSMLCILSHFTFISTLHGTTIIIPTLQMKNQKVKFGLKFQNLLQSIFRGSRFKHNEVNHIYLVVFILSTNLKEFLLEVKLFLGFQAHSKNVDFQ